MEYILERGKRWFTQGHIQKEKKGNYNFLTTGQKEGGKKETERRNFEAGLKEIWWFCRWSYPGKFNNKTIARNISQTELSECLTNLSVWSILLVGKIIPTPPDVDGFKEITYVKGSNALSHSKHLIGSSFYLPPSLLGKVRPSERRFHNTAISFMFSFYKQIKSYQSNIPPREGISVGYA